MKNFISRKIKEKPNYPIILEKIKSYEGELNSPRLDLSLIFMWGLNKLVHTGEF